MPERKMVGLIVLVILLLHSNIPAHASLYQEMGAGAQALVQEILEQVRPREAIILEMSHDEIYLNLGREEVSLGQVFEVYGVGEVILDPKTQEILGTTEDHKGTIEIIRVRDKTSIGRVIGEVESPIQPGDLAYQRVEGVRRRVAVYRFATAKGEISEFAWNLQEMIISRLARTYSFQVIERQQLDQLLEELHYSYTGLIEESTAQEAGRLLGADTVLMGSLADLGESIEINGRLTETMTGKTIATSTVRIEKDAILERMLHTILEKEEEDERREPEETLITGIRILPGSREIQIGREMAFTAQGINQYGEEIPVSATWTVEGGVGEVYPRRGERVLFRGLHAGEGQLTIELGALKTSISLTVLPPPRVLTYLDVFPKEAILEPHEMIRFTVMGLDEYREPMKTEALWYLLEDIGEVIPERGEETYFLAKEPGEGTLVVEATGIRTLIPIVVEEAPRVDRFDLIAQEEVFYRGQSYEISSVAWDQYGEEISISPEWSVSSHLGEFSSPRESTITFRALKAGEGMITATSDSVSSSLPITIIEPPLVKILIEPGELTLKTSETRNLQVKGYNSLGERIDIKAQWRILGEVDIGRVESTRDDWATFQAHKSGTGLILAQVGQLVETIEVRVEERIPSYMVLYPKENDLRLGRREIFTATVLDQDKRVMQVTPQWRIADNLGEVSITSSGSFELIPRRRGSSILSASYGDLLIRLPVTVNYRGVGLTYLHLEPLEMNLPVLTFSSGSRLRGQETGLSYRKVEIEREPAHLLWFHSVNTLFLLGRRPSPFLALRSQLGLSYFGEDSSQAGEVSLVNVDQGVEAGLLIPLGKRVELSGSYGYSFDGLGFYEDHFGAERERKKDLGDLVRSYFNISLRFLF